MQKQDQNSRKPTQLSKMVLHYRQTDRQTDNENETNYKKTESNVNNELYLILFSYN